MGRLRLSPLIAKRENLLDLRYDAILLGSDEIWNVRNPWTSADLAYFGAVGGSCPVSAYAPSFGAVDQASELSPEIQQALRRLHYVSGRDPNTVGLLAALGLNAPLVVDPTLLEGKIQHTGLAVGRDILVYGTRLDAEHFQATQAFAHKEQLGMRSIIYPQAREIPHSAYVMADDFLGFMQNAHAVVTSTLHGAVYALLYGKPFAVVMPGSKRLKIQGFLDVFGLRDRLIEQPGRIASALSTPLNLPDLRVRLAKEANRSLAYLSKALSPAAAAAHG